MDVESNSAFLNRNTEIKSTSIPTNKLNEEFFGYLLYSQMESVEAVSQLESQFIGIKQKNIYLENAVEFLKDKCSFLEKSINTLSSYMSKFENIQSSKLNLNDISTSENTQRNSNENRPFSSLIEVCCQELKCLDKTSNRQSDSLTNEDNLIKNVTMLRKHTQAREAEKSSEALDLKKKGKGGEMIQMESYYNEMHTIKCLFCSSQCSASFLYGRHQHRHVAGHSDAIKLKKETEEAEELKEIQRLFNKRVKYEVNRKFGSNFLAEHQVRELDVKKMLKIRKKVVKIFSPLPFTAKQAWSNAMNSLRQDRHQLKLKKRHSTRRIHRK